jgi:hypothetical protein
MRDYKMTDADNTGDTTSTVDRRKFVAGVGALGIAGAAGCLSDGSGDDGTDTPGTDTPTGTDGTATPGTDTPTGTDVTATPGTDTPTGTDETETDTPDDETETPTETPTGPAFEPVPTNLVYQFFDGSFDEMPNFDDMTPTSAGEPDIITSEFEDGAGAFRFEGTIPIGERLQAGTYTFHADENMVSSGQLAMYVEGNELSFSGGQTDLLLNETRDITVEYYQNSSGEEISLGWEGIHGELLPRIAESDPVRQDLQAQGRYEVEIGAHPGGKRIQMPNSGNSESKRSLAVGLPSYRNFCFDANNGGVQYGWIGAFLDYGPMVAYGGGRGDDPGQPLGETFDIGGVDYPLRIGNANVEPEVEFLGYRETPHPPELHYTVDGNKVIQEVTGVTDGVGLEYTFTFEEMPAQVVYYHTAEDANIERDASVGTWDGATLQIAERVEEFTVTITNTGLGQ